MEKFRTVGNMLIKLNSNIAALVKPEDRKDVFEDQAKSQDELLAEVSDLIVLIHYCNALLCSFIRTQLWDWGESEE